MGYIIGVLGQKGGTGKSTIARTLAVAYTAAGQRVLLADRDSAQGTCMDWNERRTAAGIEPAIDAQTFPTTTAALKAAHGYDTAIFDGAPAAAAETAAVGRAASLVILPVSESYEDLKPQYQLANVLAREGTGGPIVFALNRCGRSAAQLNEAVAWIAQTPYRLLLPAIEDKPAYRTALLEGKALTETGYATLDNKATQLVAAVTSILKESNT